MRDADGNEGALGPESVSRRNRYRVLSIAVGDVTERAEMFEEFTIDFRRGRGFVDRFRAFVGCDGRGGVGKDPRR